MDDEGWAFTDEWPDAANGFLHLHEAYTATRADYSGRVSVPVLWDSHARVIVNNESSDIMRMLDEDRSYYPAELAERIDATNAFVYENVNDGVYRCGFATTQAAYERAFVRLFNALERLEAILGENRYLVGERLTEADWRLFTTLVRFDAVYYGHFKCNRNPLAEFRHLSRYLRELYRVPGVAGTVNLEHIKRHYYMSHPHINPSRIVPLGPALDFNS